MRYSNLIRNLARRNRGGWIAIPQFDGSIRRFPADDLEAAFLNHTARLRAAALGEPLPPEHPLAEAARSSSKREWSESFFSGVALAELDLGEVEDLSE